MSVDRPFLELRSELLVLAESRLRSRADAEDVVQEAWFRWRRHHTEVETPAAWLRTVTKNLCADRLRAPARQREVPVDDQSYVGDPSYEPDPPDVAALRDGLEPILSHLTPLERSVFVLRECFEWRNTHVARLLGRHEDAVRQVARRARHHLRKPTHHRTVSAEELRRATDAFLTAHATGQVMPLLRVLAPDLLDAALFGAGHGAVVGARHEVAGMLVVQDGRLLLTRRRATLPWYPDVWDLPGSHLRATERPVNCVFRAARDELGIRPDRPQQVAALTGPDWDLEVFRVDTWEGHVRNAKPEAHDELAFVDDSTAAHLHLADPRLLDLFAHISPR